MATEADIELLVQSRMDTLRAVNHLGNDYQFSDDFQSASRVFFWQGISQRFWQWTEIG